MKIIKWISGNFLFFIVLALLVLIPLYPKIPLLDIKNTWVYVRMEDFLIVFTLLSFVLFVVKRKVTFNTPLTIPIFLFWIIGGLATLHGILLVFPTLSNVFSNVAFLSMIRRIEYLSLFFVAYASIRDKRALSFVIWVQAITLLLIVFYGLGQKYLGLPAYLTMNEEFAKGIPIQLSELSRVPSTFAGHYDLAAYLVLVIPIMVSLIFGFKNWLTKSFFLATSISGFILLFMTVSRVSVFVLLVALFIVFFFQKRKLVLYSVPVIIIGALLFLALKPTILQRFQNTVDTVDVLVDANTGNSIGH